MTVKIKSNYIALFLGIFIVVFFSGNLFGYFLKYAFKNTNIHNFTLFNMNMEANIPTYFSAFILLFSSALAGLIALCKKNKKESYVFHWAILSAVFLYLSIDEAACIHEILNRPLREMFGLNGIFYYGSVVPGIILALILLFSYFKFWRKLPSRTRYLTAIAGIFYLGGAVGMELLGGRHVQLHGNENLSYGMLTTIEETFEMIGVVIFIYALLDYLRFYIKQVVFKFE